ncbi:Hypothetical protein DHA2_8141 [Giardia duodenalis]|uniref:Uncharacterized protein n=1 Tax=Giardia intestinalis TaxID=5741 RepID=V6TCX7_GIAIN|nr:Hypothetical protein DHA2_8141 [Giardia intestinalis]
MKFVPHERGGLGPDLDRECTREAREKRIKQQEYARRLRETIQDLPKRVEKPPRKTEAELKRERQQEYAKNIPRPAVRPQTDRETISLPPLRKSTTQEERPIVKLMDMLEQHDKMLKECAEIYAYFGLQ